MNKLIELKNKNNRVEAELVALDNGYTVKGSWANSNLVFTKNGKNFKFNHPIWKGKTVLLIPITKTTKPMKATAVKKCKAVNQNDKCIVYNAAHSNKKAADSHGKKIMARGGKIKRSKTGEQYKIDYSFPKK